MTRVIPAGLDVAERAAALAPSVDVAWSRRYLGRQVLDAAGNTPDVGFTNHTALHVASGVLRILKSNGTGVQFQLRDAVTLADLSGGLTTLEAAAVSGAPVGLTAGLTELLAVWCQSATVVRFRASTDGGATWAAAATMHTAGVGNTVYSILTSPNGIVAIEERRPGLNALLYVYTRSGGAWVLYDTVDAGGGTVYGGSIDVESTTLMLFAVDVLQSTVAGTVTIRYTRIYDLDAGDLLGNLHQGSSGGVLWREPRSAWLGGVAYVLAAVQIPRASGDLSDRVALFPYASTLVSGSHPVGPPRVVYAVEDHESAALVSDGTALFVMAGSYIQRLTAASSSGTMSAAAVDLAYGPEAESLDVAGPGSLDSAALQLRCRLGLGASLADMGLFWIGGRVSAGRGGYQAAAYGLWGVLRRELQQQSGELNESGGNPMTPGKVLELIFRGLGFTYTEAAGLTAYLHPGASERIRWAMRYGQDYATLVRAILRWVGCELRTGVAGDGITPTVTVMRPGSRFGPAPAVDVALGATGDHPLIEVVSVDPETVTDATIFPGGMDHQVTLSEPVDRQLVMAAPESYGVTSTINPATRALARALAGADAGYVVCRPAVEIELWDTVSITDGPAGLAAARRLVRSQEVRAGAGRWAMRLSLGLE